MMRISLTLVLLAAMLPVHAGEFWSGLWRNADQQGDVLMQQGDAGGAAKAYTEPRRKAYAKLKAGDYQGAAEDLGNLHDSDADYNRGNALAHMGELQGALDAYDAALQSNPGNEDAKHNRELVANALKQQKSGDSKAQTDKKDGQQGQNQEQNSPSQNSPSDQNKGDGKDQQGDKDKQGEQSEKNKNEQQGKAGQADNKSGKEQDAAAQNKQEQQGKEGQQAKTAEATSKAGKDQQAAAKDDAAQARRDAEASLARPATKGNKGGEAGKEMDASNALPATAPRSEQQIAQEQWLRSIPEDPGGLLRRKFMIQHMMRQQKAQQ